MLRITICLTIDMSNVACNLHLSWTENIWSLVTKFGKFNSMWKLHKMPNFVAIGRREMSHLTFRCFCKRLGMIKQACTTQPILVFVNSIEQVEEIISCARSLRRFTGPTVKNNIYINRNFSKGEILTTYSERCRRRQHVTKRSSDLSTMTTTVTHPRTSI